MLCSHLPADRKSIAENYRLMGPHITFLCKWHCVPAWVLNLGMLRSRTMLMQLFPVYGLGWEPWRNSAHQSYLCHILSVNPSVDCRWTCNWKWLDGMQVFPSIPLPAKASDTVLVSAGIKLIFFLVAGIVLCFGFRMRIMLVTHWCFSCC